MRLYEVEVECIMMMDKEKPVAQVTLKNGFSFTVQQGSKEDDETMIDIN